VAARFVQKPVVAGVHVLHDIMFIAAAQSGVLVLKEQSLSEFTLHSLGEQLVKPSQDWVEKALRAQQRQQTRISKKNCHATREAIILGAMRMQRIT